MLLRDLTIVMMGGNVALRLGQEGHLTRHVPASGKRRTASWLQLMLVACGVSMPSLAMAQRENSVLIEPLIPPDYDRGRNVSVLERERPDYQAIGIRRGGFLIYPSLRTELGVTDNVLLSGSNRDADGWISIEPTIAVNSDWSRHQVRATAMGQFQRFLNTPRRNQNGFEVGALGRYDYGSRYSLTGEAQLSREYESPLNGAVDADLAVLSSYLRSFFSIRGEYQQDRVRARLIVDRTAIAFSDVDLGTSIRDQTDRDRVVTRLGTQLEFARTPSFSYYGRATLGRIDYSRDTLLNGAPNRDARSYRAVAGVSFDIPGRFRGALGAGISHLDYDLRFYSNVTGLSVEGQIEYFPTELTTVGLVASRTIEDSNISSSRAFFDNRLRLTVDHELLRNLILSGTTEVGRLDYIASPLRTDIMRFAARARYLSSPSLELTGGLSYSVRRPNETMFDPRRSEFRASIGVVARP
jgi:hypothetical protein